jgi:hypothetical protein
VAVVPIALQTRIKKKLLLFISLLQNAANLNVLLEWSGGMPDTEML